MTYVEQILYVGSFRTFPFSKLEVSMSSRQQRLVAVSDMRLAAIAAAAANLKIQLSELERLREQVRKILEITDLETVGCYGVTQVPN